MPTSTETRDNATTTAVTEASRVFAESSRRTLENSKAAAETARTLFDDAVELSKKLFEAWASGAEGTLKASFEVQNAGLAATLPLLEATTAAQRGALQQWEAALRQSQQAVIDAFHAQVRAAQRLAQTTTPAR